MAPSSPKLQVLWREHSNCTSGAQRAVDSKLRPPRNSAFGLFVQRMGSMTYKHRLSRWLHKRLSHTYTQAGFLSPYTIRMSTIMRDSGTYHAADQHENMRRINEALTEL